MKVETMKTGKWFLIFSLIEVITCANNTIFLAMEPFIIGGSAVSIKNYPHAAAISVVCKGFPSFCGSSILNQKIVLTAAHCVYLCDLKKDLIEIMVGHSHINKMKVKRRVDKMKIHENYSETTLENDIALVLVEGVFPLGTSVKRIVIARNFPDYSKSFQGYVAGWGKFDEALLQISPVLKRVYQKLRSIKTCANAIGDMHMGMFCAGSLYYTDHVSQGDSGSALVMMNRFQQIGVVSFRRAAIYPSLMVYTNVSYYYDWILNNARQLFCTNKKKGQENKVTNLL